MAKTDAKTAMAQVIKYHFWGVALIALMIGLACWFVAASSLSDQYNKRVQKLTSDWKKMQAIATEKDHPNDLVLQSVEKVAAAADANVLKAWQELWERQEKDNPWPKILSEEFLRKIRSLKPKDEIPGDLRGIYSNFVHTYLPELKKIVNAKSSKEVQPAAGDVSVEWLDADFNRLAKRFRWPSGIPSSMEVRLAQEDLWVYEALLRVLRDTNKGANGRAAVKRIEILGIGKVAADAWAKAAPGGVRGSAATPDNTLAANPDDADTTAAPPPMSKEIKELLDSRYVDNKGKPLLAGVTGQFPQYKMMPIYMRLRVSQEHIGRLLAECANSTMPVEVQLVKLSEISGSGVTRSLRGDDTEDRSLLSKQKASQSTDITIEIFGVISIFNQPPASKASTEDGAAEDAA